MIGTIVSHHREVKKLGEIQREFPRHNDGETTCAVGARGRQGLQAGASSVAFRNFGDYVSAEAHSPPRRARRGGVDAPLGR